MTVLQIITLSKDIIVGVAAITAAIIGFLGLRIWKWELKGRSEFELAKKLLRAVYRVNEAFKHVRNPFIMAFEYPEDMTDHIGHLKKEHEHKGNVHVYETRWKVLGEAFVKLEELSLDAQVEWGSEFQESISSLRSRKMELNRAILSHLDSLIPGNGAVLSGNELIENKKILYFMPNESEHDTLTPKIDEAIDKYEKKLRPIVQRI